jgi:nicotinate dehydrogenase subunit B
LANARKVQPAAAIANAVYDALGIRVRSLPLTAEQLMAAMPD